MNTLTNDADLTPSQIAEQLSQITGEKISNRQINQCLQEIGF